MVLVYFYYNIYLINNLKVKILIKIDIISLERIILNLSN